MASALITFTILRNFKREVLPAIELNMDWRIYGHTDQNMLDTWLAMARSDPEEALMDLHPFDAESIVGVQVESIEGKLI